MDREKERKAARNYSIGVNVFVLIFGVIWTVIAVSMFPPMGLFGIGFVGLAAYRLVMSIKLNKKDGKEKEPWDRTGTAYGAPRRDFSTGSESSGSTRETAGSFCPYCGRELEESFRFCPKCGRRL